MFDDIKGVWAAMMAATRRGRSKTGRHAAIEWNKVAGYVRSIEVTNEGKGWHWHIHVFALVTDWIDQRKLSEEWQRFGGGQIVDVRECRDGIVPGLIETLKYTTKMAKMTPADLYEVHVASKGSRMLAAGGLLLGVPEPDIRMDDISDQSGPYRDFIARWLNERYELELLSEGDDTPETSEELLERARAALQGAQTLTAADFAALDRLAEDPAQRAALEAMLLAAPLGGESASEIP